MCLSMSSPQSFLNSHSQFSLLNVCLSAVFFHHSLTYDQSSPSQGIRRTIEEKVEEVLNILNKDLQMVNKELNERMWSPLEHIPRLAAQAYWSTSLKQRLAGPMEVNS